MKNIFKEKKMKNLIYPRQNGKLLMALLMALFLFSCRSGEPDAPDDMPDPPDLVCKAGSNDNCQEIFLTNAGIRCPDGLARVSERCTGARLATCDNGAGIRWDYFGYDAFQLVSEQQTCESMGHTWAPQSDPPVSFGVNVTTPDVSITTESGRSVTFTFVLTGQPTANVTITPTSSDDGEGTVSGALIFTSDNWNTPQPLTITGVNDDIADGNQSYQITFTVSSEDTNYNNFSLDPVDVTNTDNNTPGITLIVADSTTSESANDNTGTIHLVLNAQPTDDVMITPESDTPGEGTVSGALIFTSDNWDTEQQINVTGVNDEIADGDQNYQITFTVSSTDTNYNNFSLNPVGMTNADNDTARVTLTPSGSETTEAGGTVMIRVVLDAQPTADVVVTPASSDTGEGTVNGALTFTTSTWNTPQQVTVTGINDDIDDGDQSYQITFTVSSTDTNYNNFSLDPVAVTNTDNDTAGVKLTPSGSETTEAGGTVTIGVIFTTQPTADVVVTPESSDTGEGTVSGALTFTSGNWNTPQQVTVTGVNDNIDDENQNYQITFTVRSDDTNYNEVIVSRVDITNTDDDTAAFMVVASPAGDGPTGNVGEDVGRVIYTVSLSSGPLVNVTVDYTIRGTAGPDDYSVTAFPTSSTSLTTLSRRLIFTPTNWATAQEVTVMIADDAVDETNDNETLIFTLRNPTGGTELSTSRSVTTTIQDDDTRGVKVDTDPVMTGDQNTLTVAEGSTGTYTVVLTSQPSAAVTLTVGGASSGVSVSPTSLTFPVFNWNMAQTVTVRAAEDDNAVDEMVTLTNTASSSGDYGSSETASVMVTVDDNDTRGVMVSKTALSVTEGSTGEYTVALATQPSAAVTVTVGGVSGDVSVDTDTMTTGNQNTLTFTTSNWDDAQTVTVTAADDEDLLNDPVVTLTHSAMGGDYDGSETAGMVMVTIVEDDKATFSVTGPGTVAENAGTAAYTVSLSAQPAEDVTVDYAITGTATLDTDYMLPAPSASLTAAPSGTLRFTTTSWNRDQLITLTILDDTVDDDGETIIFTLSNPSPSTAAQVSGSPSVTTTIVDDDDPEVMASFGAAAYSVTEGGSTPVTVTLSADPERQVVIPLTATNGAGTETSDYSAPTSVTFMDGETSKTVTFTSTSDDVDELDETVTLAFGTLPARVTAGSTASTTVTITDNDTRGLTVSEVVMSDDMLTLTVMEGGMATYTVKLDSQPTAAVTVTVGGVSGDVSVSPTSLNFTTSNWDTAQTVTVTAAEDDEDAVNDTVTLTNQASGGDYGPVSESVRVTIIENDIATFMVTPPMSTVGEASGTRTAVYTVSLSARPVADVTVDYVITGTATLSDYRVSMVPVSSTSLTTLSRRLTFTVDTTDSMGRVTAGNWNTPQTITLTILDDTVDDDGETITFTLSNPTGGAALSASPSVSTTIVDDDDREVMASFAAANYSVTEGGSINVAVTLSADPERQVVIPLTATNGAGTETSDYSVPTSVTFMDGETSKTVTFTSTSDDVDESNETVTLAFGTLPARVTAGSTASTTVTITDDDTRGVTVSETALTVPEGGMATYTVVLDSEPTGSVTVTVGGASGDVSASPSSLTFTTMNWDTAQTVTVTAADDDDAVSDAAVMLTHTVSGADYGMVTAGSVTVTITENDTRGVTVSETALTVMEGMTGTYTVVLDSQPTGDVTVTVGGASGDVSASPSSLTFTTMNWDTAQTVTVTAADDDDAIVDDAVTLTHTVSGADYDSETAGSVTVTITEDDPVDVNPTFRVTGPARVGEGDGTATYRVSLSKQPDSTVTVDYATADGTATTAGSDYTAASGTLTFTTTNWDTAQTVDVTIMYDADGSASDAADETFTFTLSNPSPSENAVLSASPSVTTTITNWPNVKVSFGAAAYTVREGRTVGVVVNLDMDPRRTVTISWSRALSAGVDPGEDYTVADSVTFMSGETSKTVTFTAIADGITDSRGKLVQLSLSSLPSGVTTGSNPRVRVTIPANDT